MYVRGNIWTNVKGQIIDISPNQKTRKLFQNKFFLISAACDKFSAKMDILGNMGLKIKYGLKSYGPYGYGCNEPFKYSSKMAQTDKNYKFELNIF